MKIQIKPSDLYFKYPRDIANRDKPKFSGKPDSTPFNRNDLYEVLPMFEAVMEEVGSNDGTVLNKVEEVLDRMPAFIVTREEVFDFLVGCTRELLE